LRAETREKEELAAEDLDVARDLIRQNQEIEKKLEEVAREADKAPELKPLADLARQLAKQEMLEAERALQEGGKRNAPAQERHNTFRAADKQLDEALKKLEKLREKNEEINKDRLDQAKVEQLADRQEQLAQKAEELSGKHPTQDKDAKAEAEQLKRDQAAV